MRYSQRMDRPSQFAEATLPFAGSLLVAHPSLQDPNFRRSVVLLTAHSDEEGSLGVVVNRPMNQTLSEFDPTLSNTDLESVPLFYGGPVANDKLILVAWKWTPEEGSFKLYFGIDDVKARSLLAENSGFELRGFIGHSGWTEGQLDAEIEEGAWVTSPLMPEIDSVQGEEVWRMILRRDSPQMGLLADEPDNPSLN
ncbi:MAG TPA: YqgE/AlgH family protein [Opitutae bacterium]|nr:YqgE/AlgH family protein [Opitutae bacterium]